MSFPDLVSEAAHWNRPHLMLRFVEEFVVVVSYEQSQNKKGLCHSMTHYRVRERKQSYPSWPTFYEDLRCQRITFGLMGKKWSRPSPASVSLHWESRILHLKIIITNGMVTTLHVLWRSKQISFVLKDQRRLLGGKCQRHWALKQMKKPERQEASMPPASALT